MDIKKVCKSCGEDLFLEDFYKSSLYKDGRSSICKSCYNERGNGGNKFIGLDDSKLPDDEKEMARHVLRVLGYIVDDPNNPVYLQFKERLLEKGVDIYGDKKKSVKIEIVDEPKRVVNYGLDVKNMSHEDKRAYFNQKQKEYRERIKNLRK